MKLLLIVLILAVIGVLWYLFRPDRLFISRTINEEFPEIDNNQGHPSAISPEVLARGEFHGVAHDGQGTATLFKMANAKMVLRFTDFHVSNGPDVLVYLVALEDSEDNNSVKEAEFVSLGPIKGNVGNQNYDVPSDVDLKKYRSVTIWCRRFGVNFATAPLTPQ